MKIFSRITAGRALVAVAVLTLTLALYPVRTTLTRSGLITGTLLLTLLTLWVLFKRPKLRPLAWSLIILLLAASIFMCLPSRPYDPDALRQSYVRTLQSFRGTRYVWGGETHLGIDCSGLARAALTEACIKQGLRTANPGLLRSALDIWWNDCPAHGLMDGYQGRTLPLPAAPAVKTLERVNYSALLPGDFAVTADGTHTLAYLGPQNGIPTWIESDPFPMHVIELQLHQTQSYWWTVPVQLRRWKALENP